MIDGFIKVAAATPKIKVADCEYNADRILELIHQAEENQVKVVVLPELCITGYTCGELFLQDTLLASALQQLERIIKETSDMEVLVTLGVPVCRNGKLLNTAAVIHKGKLLGLVPKRNLPNYSEFYEARYFMPGPETVEYISVFGQKVPLGTKLLFSCSNLPALTIGVEICEDLWVPMPPSVGHTMAGATLILNPSASDETTGKDIYRRDLIKMQSAKLVCGYIYADSGEGESTTDLVFAGHNLIAENGLLLKESKRFQNEFICSELDVQKLTNERRRMTTFSFSGAESYEFVNFSYGFTEPTETKLTRFIDKAPFVPGRKEERDRRCEEIINIQAYGLKKRLEHTGLKCAVIAISGGLDSTLALLVTCKAFDLLKLDRKGIVTVTMPCFGTTDRTYRNALSLAEQLGTDIKEIPIKDAVLLHFRDIGHDKDVHDITYENSQARERTQIIMDLSNKYNGLVIGTGDMSELALGWATYNGDHMSMYGVNASVPKTLVRYLVSYFAETTEDEKLRSVLLDVLDTPVSPELLPPVEGEIVQKTEDIVGPYELHDFYMYYILRFGFTPTKIYRLAVTAFDGMYDKDTILKWLKTFYRRFFSQQFKRSCLPDGPKVGSVAVSPRGDLRMPSDASAALWLNELNKIQG
ncbi:NAD(+) synthase [Anaerocolumna cellulosilytica]|uniref:Glutamine-dependent NAD(+) synthetase n=1 Tax=Anaerocolumna cellulosilytica TaxID=433286 RepID=A0A6S6R279_9FIRM|nr:NAD(+) synthase [Anaerocolumna cellulosilytica]MBB5197821.1 NAD+ synthase (glutamine-hydrolyzing) [Anaerocolumna cellulosilytica]BCJ96236.1 NAD(+) synthase [Anaerocolumna cellulosilytica]